MIKKEIADDNQRRLLISVTEKLDSLSLDQLKEVDKFIERLNNDNSEDFIIFWATWRELATIKNQSKKNTMKAFNRAVKKTSLENIVKAINAQSQERDKDREFGKFVPDWKHAATWLNQEMWDTEIEEIDWSDYKKAVKAIAENPKLESEFRKHNNRGYNEWLLTNNFN